MFPGFVRDAGMFAASGASLPPGVGTVTPEEVAAGIVRAVERNRAEVDVAPLGLRLGARVAGVAPGLPRRSSAGWAATASRARSPTASASAVEQHGAPRVARAGAARARARGHARPRALR